ncbi:30S ribosomal protein S1, partial [Bacteroidales bacterium OttesenSCG-928-A14]|nr:30S ribosomal protein S1 [Bacteroidales bacterium OttesenSCG-928-A14]
LPGSQIDVKPIRDYDIYVDKTMEFKVVKINHEYKNVVVSHKALIEDELEAQKAEIIAKLEKGQILEGTVKNITSYGVFIDLGGVDGLIHITDLSWGRIIHPEEIVQLDQKINVVILDFDENKKRIALGLKQLTPHPWDALDANLNVGDKVKGKVVVIADYGAFIELLPGVEGLIHVSEMSWSQHLRTAHDFLKVGDEIEAVILTLDREERKMSLGIKQLIPDPWENIMEKYPVGSKHTSTVRNFTNFGIFVELEEGVDGLIHISDLSWSKKIKHPAEFTKIGEAIEVVVLEVDRDNRRLSLGHKQLEENPWDVFESVFTVGSTHEGTIISQNDKGVVVALPYGIEGFAFNRAIMKEDKSVAKIEEVLPFRVVEFSKEAKKINLSHVKTWQESREDEDNRVQSEERKKDRDIMKINESSEKTTLGDIEALKNLKEDMEKQEGEE